MTKKIKKTIIESNFRRERFFPLAKVVAPELFNLADRPILQWLVDEAVSMGSEEIIFLSEEDSTIESFFSNLEEQEDLLKKKGNPRANKIKEFKEKYQKIKISFSDFSKLSIGDDDFAYISSNELISYKENCLQQVMSVFKTSERPVIALRESEIGEIETEKIARGLYKIKGFSDQSEFSLIGRAIFTSKSRKFFEEATTIREALENMMARGHTVYGTVIKGDYFKLNNFEDYLKSNLYFTFNAKNGKELSEELKEKGLI
jgi:UTP--glucose-1-phosphate uridylyltransferase